MPTPSIYGAIINGTAHNFDYDHLDGKPIPSSSELTAGDVGKVVMAGSQSYTLQNAYSVVESGMLALASSAGGRIPCANADYTELDWIEPTDLSDYIIPNYDNVSEERILAVGDSDGSPVLEWVEPPASLPSSGCSGDVLVCGDNGPVWSSALSILLQGSSDQLLVCSSSRSLAWADFASVLPTANTDGMCLMFRQGGVEWASPFPSYDTDYNDGSVLTVTNGTLGWTEPTVSLPTDGTFNIPYVFGFDDNGDAGWKTLDNAFQHYPANGKALGYSNNELGWFGVGDLFLSSFSTTPMETEYLVYDTDTAHLSFAPSPIPSYGSVGTVLSVGGTDGYPHLVWEYIPALPPYDTANAGSILMVGDSDSESPLVWASWLPSYNNQNVGDILMVGSCEEEPQLVWCQFPSWDASENGTDAGKVLSVNEYGNLVWRALT